MGFDLQPLGTSRFGRRAWLQMLATLCAGGMVQRAVARVRVPAAIPESCPITLGKVVWVSQGQRVDDVVRGVRDQGLRACQIGFDGLSLADAAPLRAALDRYGVEGTAINEHNPGARVFDFRHGPQTIGIIPPATRTQRIAALKLAAAVAQRAGVPAVHTHCGFIPEDPNDPLYAQAVAAVREIAGYCRERGLMFLCETGQETPITLMRLIEDVKLPNVFINLDVANLILYGKGNPVDAMDVFRDRVRGIHAKDGRFPTDPESLGEQVPIGQGRVDFVTLLQRLKDVQYHGPMHLELETGDEAGRAHELVRAREYLSGLLAHTYGSSKGATRV